jgi:outer membrane lipoprotein-sorting protein
MKRCKLGQPIEIIFLLLTLLPIRVGASNLEEAQALLERMQSAYEKVKDYRVLVKVVTAENGGNRTEEFIYTFKKPNHIRIDFLTPQPGTILIYPDKENKVSVRPWGWSFLDLHLSPDSFLLANPSGQRIDQTDFGLLIKNIGRSMDGGRRGPLEILDEARDIRIRVLAEDHFRAGKITKYQFIIDKNTYLPAEVEQWTPEGVFERKISFRNLEININVPDSFFHLAGE